MLKPMVRAAALANFFEVSRDLAYNPNEALREAGRLPMLSEAISETTVDCRK